MALEFQILQYLQSPKPGTSCPYHPLLILLCGNSPTLEGIFCGDPGTSTYCSSFWQQEPLVTRAAIFFSINSSVGMYKLMLPQGTWEAFQELKLSILWPQVRRQYAVIFQLDKVGLLGCFPKGTYLSTILMRQSRNANAIFFQVNKCGWTEKHQRKIRSMKLRNSTVILLLQVIFLQ